MIAFDTETTGISAQHGSLPFFITIYDETDEHTNYDWPVDPITRKPTIPKEDVEQLKHLIQLHKNWGEPRYSKEIANRHTLILQNPKFDVTMMGCVDEWFRINWPWNQTRDTLIAGHLLDSGNPHNLTDMVMQYLNKNIKQFEDKIEKATQKARRYVRKHFPKWRIAKEGDPMMPSVKSGAKASEDRTWHSDMWLPKTLLEEIGHDKLSEELETEEHNWDTLLAKYANADTFFTFHLWQVMEKLLNERDLWEIFESRMKLLPIALKMEHRGVTLSKTRLNKLQDEYEKAVDRCETICTNIAQLYKDDNGEPIQLKLPKSGNNKQLTDLIFNRMKLPVIKETKSDNPSLDKEVLEDYVQTLPHKSNQLLFVQNLVAMRKRATAVNYIEGYRRHYLPLGGDTDEWYKLHSNLNPTGTAHLRWACSNPNNTNISKKEGFNLRQGFGPANDREWWSLDAQNIELRIPAFESGEQDLMDIFLYPDKAPYYGSYHLAVFDLLYPELFKKHGKACKDLYESTFYQWVKNGNFAIIYGCQEAKADATYHFKGAFKRIRYRFPKIAQLADKQIAIANKTGGIETIPDKTVNPRRGYPIRCSFGSWGKVKPTLPLNYHTSGTAMQWMNGAMIDCDEELVKWYDEKTFDAFITLQVHDELVFDLPKGTDPTKDKEGSNLPRIKRLQKLMEQQGDKIGIPTPVSVEYNPHTWDTGIRI